MTRPLLKPWVFLCLLITVCLGMPGHAYEPPQRIEIEDALTGATTATLPGSLEAGKYARYLLQARKGQWLTLRLVSDRDEARLNLGSRNGPPAYPGAGLRTEWQGSVPSDGVHAITVLAGAASAEFVLHVTLKPFIHALSFEEDRNSLTIKGDLARGESAHYLLQAWKGQFLHVRVQAPEGKARMWVENERSEPVQPGPGTVAEWKGRLRRGDFHVISLRGEESVPEYTLEVTLLPLPPGPVTYRVTGASRRFDFEIRHASRKTGLTTASVDGSARVAIRRKGAKTELQSVTMPHFVIYDESLHFNPMLSRESRDGRSHSLVVDDFNFDGHEDLALCNGHNGNYSASSYRVFLWDPRRRRFVVNVALSRLTEEYAGLFTVDRRRRRLIAHAKSGALWSLTHTYRIAGARPILVEKIVDDATSEVEVITTRRRVGGRWVTWIRRKRR